MYLDEKVIIWNRIDIPEGQENKVIEALKAGKTVMDIIGEIIDDPICEMLYETEEIYPRELNGKFPTIEVTDDETVIYSN